MAVAKHHSLHHGGRGLFIIMNSYRHWTYLCLPTLLELYATVVIQYGTKSKETLAGTET